MTLIDQYLAAVAAQLPAAKRDDIIAELRDALMERVEDREAELGRPMTEAETEALLREFGHPLTVAARYRGGPDHLIGPELFPYWFFAVKAALLILAVVVVMGAIGGVMVGEVDVARAFGGIWDDLLSGGAMIVGAAAVAGFIIERQPTKPEFMTHWRVKDLELFRRWSLNGDGFNAAADETTRGEARVVGLRTSVGRRRRSVVGNALVRVAAMSVFLLWWVGAFDLGGLTPQQLMAAFGAMLPGVDYGEALSGLVHPLYWPVIGYGLARIALELGRAAAPRAVRALAVGDLLMAGVGAAFLYWIWMLSPLAPVARVESLDQLADWIRELFHGRFNLQHLVVLVLIGNAIQIAARALDALRRLAIGR